MDSQSLATVVLVGHPDLRRTLHLTIHEAFNQRLAVRYHLGPLDLQETIGCVKHQTQVAGYKAGILFTNDALQRIFEYTKGLPRRINQVCTTALMAGLIDQKSVLDESTLTSNFYFASRFLNSSASARTIWNKSPTTPKSML